MAVFIFKTYKSSDGLRRINRLTVNSPDSIYSSDLFVSIRKGNLTLLRHPVCDLIGVQSPSLLFSAKSNICSELDVVIKRRNQLT